MKHGGATFSRAASLLFAGGLLVGLLWPQTSSAIPAFARKYGAGCNLCHYPNIPRLNSYGERFRRAGFRTEQEIDKSQEITKVGDFLSVRGRVHYQADFLDHVNDQNRFRLNDVTFFYAGAFSPHFSAFTETEIGQDGEVELLATAHAIYGEWGNFASVRVGQMHTLTRTGFGGLDRPTGISTPAIFTSRELTLGGVPFRLSEDQRGIEVAYVYQDSRIYAQVLNGVNVENGVGKGRAGDDADQDKDYLFAFEQIVDDIASGFTLFGYRGTVHFDPSTGDFAKGPANRFDFWRYGVTGNKVIEAGPVNLDFLAGYVRSEDEVRPVSLLNNGRDISGNAFFVGLEQYFKDYDFTLFQRYDHINPKVGFSGDETKIGTVGVVAPVEDYLRVALEGSIINKEPAISKRPKDTNDYRVLGEVQFNF